MSTTEQLTRPDKAPATPPGRAPRFGDFGFKPREREVVQAELDALKARFGPMERQNAEHRRRREIILAMNEKVVKDWGRNHPEMPLAPHDVPGTAPVPPLDSPVGREFHRLHYDIERTEKELEAAKQAETAR